MGTKASFSQCHTPTAPLGAELCAGGQGRSLRSSQLASLGLEPLPHELKQRWSGPQYSSRAESKVECPIHKWRLVEEGSLHLSTAVAGAETQQQVVEAG